MSNLCLIIGAGASYDCIISSIEVPHTPDSRPPLTKDLFSPNYDTILRKYPKASALAGEIRWRLKRDNSLSLEQLLRTQQDKSIPTRQKQLNQIPLYLRELFSRISRSYVDPSRTCYAMLINDICEKDFDQILVINLNYDTFFEDALQIILDLEFKEIGNYFHADKRWKILKPHGSINWIKKLVWPYPLPSKKFIDYIRYVDMLDNFTYDGEILVDDTQTNFVDNQPVYPCMVVPVDGKYGFLCPEYQVEGAKNVLKYCDAYLAIGCSFKDKDLIDFLSEYAKKSLTPQRVQVVNPIPQDFDMWLPFKETLASCLGNYKLSANGFSAYVDSGECAKYLEYVCK